MKTGWSAPSTCFRRDDDRPLLLPAMTFVVGAAYMADRPMAGGQSASKILYQNDVWILACCMLHVDGAAAVSELPWDSQKCMWLTAHINPTASRAFHTIRPVMVMPLKPP